MAERARLRGDELATSPKAAAAAERTVDRIAARPAPTRGGGSRVPSGVNANRPGGSAVRPPPRPPGPRPSLGGLSNPQRVLFVTWAAAIGLRAYSDVRLTKDWPCPGPLLRISALYLILGLASEAAPSLAAWLGVGFFVAFLTRAGGREVQQRGTFFGVPVRR